MNVCVIAYLYLNIYCINNISLFVKKKKNSNKINTFSLRINFIHYDTILIIVVNNSRFITCHNIVVLLCIIVIRNPPNHFRVTIAINLMYIVTRIYTLWIKINQSINTTTQRQCTYPNLRTLLLSEYLI